MTSYDLLEHDGFRQLSAPSTLEGTGSHAGSVDERMPHREPGTVEPGLLLELRISAPDIEWPLMIVAASMQWVSGQTFGLAFFRIEETAQARAFGAGDRGSHAGQ